MNLETATDFELNKKLTEMRTVRVISCDKIEVKGAGVRSIDYPINYCTNWNDIMPIAVELKIKLDPRRSLPKLGWMASLDDQNYAVDKSPQRALVICCIKVLEGK